MRVRVVSTIEVIHEYEDITEEQAILNTRQEILEAFVLDGMEVRTDYRIITQELQVD